MHSRFHLNYYKLIIFIGFKHHLTMIILASQSQIKINAVKQFFKSVKLETYSASEADLPNQPINSALECAKHRIQFIKNKYDLPKYQYIIAIENGLKVTNHLVEDIAYIVIENKYGSQYYGWSKGVPVPMDIYHEARNLSDKLSYDHLGGMNITVGEIISKKYKVPADDWMSIFKDSTGINNRHQQIMDAFVSINL